MSRVTEVLGPLSDAVAAYAAQQECSARIVVVDPEHEQLMHDRITELGTEIAVHEQLAEAVKANGGNPNPLVEMIVTRFSERLSALVQPYGVDVMLAAYPIEIGPRMEELFTLAFTCGLRELEVEGAENEANDAFFELLAGLAGVGPAKETETATDSCALCGCEVGNCAWCAASCVPQLLAQRAQKSRG
jgi:hypothetical protein